MLTKKKTERERERLERFQKTNTTHVKINVKFNMAATSVSVIRNKLFSKISKMLVFFKISFEEDLYWIILSRRVMISSLRLTEKEYHRSQN